MCFRQSFAGLDNMNKLANPRCFQKIEFSGQPYLAEGASTKATPAALRHTPVEGYSGACTQLRQLTSCCQPYLYVSARGRGRNVQAQQPSIKVSELLSHITNYSAGSLLVDNTSTAVHSWMPRSEVQNKASSQGILTMWTSCSFSTQDKVVSSDWHFLQN
jgi:hypothetical protein